MYKERLDWHCYRKPNSVQKLATVIAVLIYPSVALYRLLKEVIRPHIPANWKKAILQARVQQTRALVTLCYPVYGASHFDVDKQKYAGMATDSLTKQWAILQPRARNPQTDWDKSNAERHVAAIQAELIARSLQLQKL